MKRLENNKDRNEELLNVCNKRNKAFKNKINIHSKNVTYHSKHSFVTYKDIDDIKELPLDSMYKRLNNFNDEINNLNDINPRKKKHKRIKE